MYSFLIEYVAKYGYQVGKFIRFGDKLYRSQAFCVIYGWLMGSGGEYYNRYIPEVCMFFDFRQELLACHYRHVQVEEDNIGSNVPCSQLFQGVYATTGHNTLHFVRY